jgi:F-type H+-transporting ATPase subunit b
MGLLKKREEKIRESIDGAERTRSEAEKLLEDYRKQLSEARREAQGIIEQGKKVGESAKAEIVEKANKEAQQMIEQARSEIEREKMRALSELQVRVADLTVLTTSKIIKKSLSGENHLRLIEESLAEVSELEK